MDAQEQENWTGMQVGTDGIGRQIGHAAERLAQDAERIGWPRVQTLLVEILQVAATEHVYFAAVIGDDLTVA